MSIEHIRNSDQPHFMDFKATCDKWLLVSTFTGTHGRDECNSEEILPTLGHNR